MHHNADWNTGQIAQPMTLRIERAARQGLTVFALCGRIDAEQTEELRRLIELEADRRGVVVDLKDVKLVAREAVKFLAHCEADGIKLENCPAYIREWILREGSSSSDTKSSE